MPQRPCSGAPERTPGFGNRKLGRIQAADCDVRPARRALTDLNRPLMFAPSGTSRSIMVGNAVVPEAAQHKPAPGSVSAIICAYNEADRIGKVLRAVVGH